MRVVATERGYDGSATREQGDEFDMPEGSSGAWFKVVPVAVDEPEAEKRKPGRPKKDDS